MRWGSPICIRESEQVSPMVYDSSASEMVAEVPTSTVFWKLSQVTSHSGGTRRVCRECNLTTCGPKRGSSPSKMPKEGDSPSDAATMSGIVSTT